MTSPPDPDSSLDVDLVVLDVNETLSDLRPLQQAFTDVGLPSHLSRLWFASVLRDGFALTIGGGRPRFADLGGDALRALLVEHHLDGDTDAAVRRVLEVFLDLDTHPDVPDGLRRLAGGRRVVTMSNGAARVAERLLERAGVRDTVEKVLSVDDAGTWKPSRRAYDYALETCGVDAGRAALVAVHPWDVDGARRAGMVGVWVRRSGEPWPSSFPPADATVTGLGDLADRLGC